MPILESCLTILGATSGVATLHGYVAGLKTGKQIEQIINEQAAMQSKVEKLAEHILHMPSVQEVRVVSGNSEKESDLRNLREILDPVQNCLDEDILSTAVLSTPAKLRQAFQNDPFEVLIETRPVNRAKKPSNPDLLPILFFENGVYYIGWQTSGALPLLFDCEYSPNNIITPRPSEVGNSEQEKTAESRHSRAGGNPVPQEGQKITNSLGMEFVYIPPGTFMMGSPSNESGWNKNETQYQVTLTRGFHMQTTPVTQRQWKEVMKNNPSRFKNCDDCPVESVSWNDVQEFLKELSQMEGTNQYRLPTEAEWEYACRAGTETAYSFGSAARTLGEYAWFYENSGNRTHPVAQLRPNAWGLYDMHGNVWDWCQDWYGDYPGGDVSDPVGPSSGSSRVIRGGSWYYYAPDCRSAPRYNNSPGPRYSNIGFRHVRS